MQVLQDNHGRHLPSDIIFIILLRLPVKTLCRFSCVSKSWSALISSPIFRRSHLKQSEQNPILLLATADCSTQGCNKLHFSSLDKEKTRVKEFTKPMPKNSTRLLISSVTCFALVCLFDDNGDIYICNPATEELMTLPKESPNYESYTLYRVALGFVTSADEYKVLRMVVPLGHDNTNGAPLRRCEILTLGVDKRWRSAEVPSVRDLTKPVFAGGAIHMLPRLYSPTDMMGIFRFDLEREEWSGLPLPALARDVWHLLLRQIDGVLCLVNFATPDWTVFDMWFLEDCRNGVWVKRYSLDVNLSIARGKIRPLAVEDDGRILIEVRRRRLLRYDIKSERFEEINIGRKQYFSTSFYVESFLSLGGR